MPTRAAANAMLVTALALVGCGESASEVGSEAPVSLAAVSFAGRSTYVGRDACIACHETQHDLWAGSHHDLAMDVATDETVLGDFEAAAFTHYGVTSTFFKRDGRFVVRTDGPDGKLLDYEIAYTFGVTPLQQYLVEFPGGRYQVLGLCWDTRLESEGGQRWFHIYPDEAIPHDDVLHWTGPNQNWNYMCAECHSTNLMKGYDLETSTYDTTWAEIDVSCEACHGPGSIHVAWAQDPEPSRGRAADKGLDVVLKNQVTWLFDGDNPTATLRSSTHSDAEIESCARCHSRRGQIHADYVYGRPLLDTHRLSLLDLDLYHTDGQIRDEVYVHGSFLQSRMYAQGVRCSDCHDPHSLDLHADGNVVCYRCHQPAVFNTPSHHHHEPDTPGSGCVDCHMPARTYMVVDPRRDHSFRVPRPDLSLRLATPNACNQCHTDRSPEWAAEAVARWYGPGKRMDTHFGEALHAGRAGDLDALAGLAGDPDAPGIARATALAILGRSGDPTAVSASEASLADANPVVRAAAVDALQFSAADDRLRLAMPLLADPVRLVRISAARVLAPVASSLATSSDREAFVAAARGYVEGELANADRPEAHVNIGNFYGEMARYAEAEAAYRQALRLDPSHVRAYVNLADLLRTLDRDDEGETLLRRALEIEPDLAAAHHALGLLLIRRDDLPGALDSLARAVRLQRENARFAYVYAIALNSVGQQAEALWELQNAHARHPNDRDILMALVSVHHQMGTPAEAMQYLSKLGVLAPDDPQVQQLLQQFQPEGG